MASTASRLMVVSFLFLLVSVSLSLAYNQPTDVSSQQAPEKPVNSQDVPVNISPPASTTADFLTASPLTVASQQNKAQGSTPVEHDFNSSGLSEGDCMHEKENSKTVNFEMTINGAVYKGTKTTTRAGILGDERIVTVNATVDQEEHEEAGGLPRVWFVHYEGELQRTIHYGRSDSGVRTYEKHSHTDGYFDPATGAGAPREYVDIEERTIYDLGQELLTDSSRKRDVYYRDWLGNDMSEFHELSGRQYLIINQKSYLQHEEYTSKNIYGHRKFGEEFESSSDWQYDDQGNLMKQDSESLLEEYRFDIDMPLERTQTKEEHWEHHIENVYEEISSCLGKTRKLVFSKEKWKRDTSDYIFDFDGNYLKEYRKDYYGIRILNRGIGKTFERTTDYSDDVPTQIYISGTPPFLLGGSPVPVGGTLSISFDQEGFYASHSATVGGAPDNRPVEQLYFWWESAGVGVFEDNASSYPALRLPVVT